MNTSTNLEIVSIPHFINSTRDSGYKSTSSAIAEIVDNSLEAGAKNVFINISKSELPEFPYRLSIVDDGSGMGKDELLKALQFGGSSKYNNRGGLGRYGMGLPNASLSQTKRVEVHTWKDPREILWNYLDVDEITRGETKSVAIPKKVKQNDFQVHSPCGTIVSWVKCDRIDNKNISTLVEKLHKDLGRIFRKQLWAGKKILLNKSPIKPVDPLYYRKGNNLTGAILFGKELFFDVKVPGIDRRSSRIKILFTELPLEDWSLLSNDEKNDNGISKKAGISILRADREIDYGWYFTGSKRKENYDDWWRCELSFSPELDELFGVTHTKQEIRPTEILKSILTPDIESTARLLNNRVRDRFTRLKQNTIAFPAKSVLEKTNSFLEPPQFNNKPPLRPSKSHSSLDLVYKISLEEFPPDNFFRTEITSEKFELKINIRHPFFTQIYSPLVSTKDAKTDFRKNLEILIFAAARAESLLDPDNQLFNKFKENWGKALSAFLS